MHLKINVSKSLKRKAKASDVTTSLAFLILFISTYYQIFIQLDEKLNQYIFNQTHTNLPIVLDNEDKLEENPINISAIPVSITISRIGITNLEIVPGGIINNEWLLFNDKATYLQTSGLLGEGYNTIIYAHRRENLFIDLNQLKKKDIIEVLGNNEKVYKYEVYNMEVVNIDNVEKLKTVDSNILTLFTCEGIIDQQRLIIQASLILE